MNKQSILLLINVYAVFFILLFTDVESSALKAFNNPLNGKAVDLFILVDEQNSYMNEMQLGLMKNALDDMVKELNPTGSSPYFGIYFYGAASSLSSVVPYPTASAVSVKSYLDQKQYTRTQLNPATLTSALATVDSLCSTKCRSGIPRATIVISSVPDSLAESSIRQLERKYGMSVIVVGIGLSTSLSTLKQLSSQPSRYYAIPVSTFYELILTAKHIASVVSDIPRLIDVNNYVSISPVSVDIYYTVQLNTASYTNTNDTIVIFASNCAGCKVYGSLSEPNPTSSNTLESSKYQAYAGNCYSYQNYFRIPQDTSRLYVSVRGNGVSAVYISANIFKLPNMMSPLTRNSQDLDLSQTMG